jgi:hypothetical protein
MPVVKAEVGDIVEATKWGRPRLPVYASCGTNGHGSWTCVTHPEDVLENNFQKDSHISRGRHRLAWFCNSCNQFEVP